MRAVSYQKETQAISSFKEVLVTSSSVLCLGKDSSVVLTSQQVLQVIVIIIAS
jgi:hypothetical protein